MLHEVQQTTVDTRIASLAWLIVTTLISWNLYTTNKLQLDLVQIANDFKYIGNEIVAIKKHDQKCEYRLDSLEPRVARLEHILRDVNSFERHNNKEREVSSKF